MSQWLRQSCHNPLLSSVAMLTLLGSFSVHSPVKAQQVLECEAQTEKQEIFYNQAQFSYKSSSRNLDQSFQGLSNQITTQVVLSQVKVITEATGVYDEQGNLIIGLGTVVDSVNALLAESSLSSNQIETVGLAAAEEMRSFSGMNSLQGAVEELKTAMVEAVSEESLQAEVMQLDDTKIGLIILGFGSHTLQAMKLPATTLDQVTSTAYDILRPLMGQATLMEAEAELESALSNLLTEDDRLLFDRGRTAWTNNITALRQNSDTANFQPGETLTFSFTLTNTGDVPTTFTLPPLSTWEAQAMAGNATLKRVSYGALNGSKSRIDTEQQKITISPNVTLEVIAEVTLGEEEAENSHSIRLGLGADANCQSNVVQQTVTVVTPVTELGDPFGRVTGCNGEVLPNYAGFTIGLYEPVGGTEVGEPIRLTRTELPDNPNNNISAGLEPNIENSNPFFLTNEDEGKYNFLLDISRGQLDNGDTYILFVNPPESSIYDERRIRIEIGQRTDNLIPFTARSLDGLPISVTDPLGRTIVEGTFVVVEDAERLGLNLAVIDFQATTCQAEEVDIDKFADRTAAEIGDIVLYQLRVRNLSADAASSLNVTDVLPAGLNFIPESVRGGIGKEEVALTVNQQQRQIGFRYDATFGSSPELASGETLTIVYGAEVTPDAMRGSGINTASVEARIIDRIARDGPVNHELDIRPGLLNDCGTVIGKVFVDKNFDGQQQSGEPGVPNAVIYFQNGNRITTDKDGVYSVTNVCPGNHTGILDLTTTPGYQIAPNIRRRDQRGPSRLFRMSPGSMVRVNFGLTPTAEEEEQ